MSAQLPHSERAFVPDDKILNYLLSEDHPVGRHKAKLFIRYGFTRDNWHILRDCLLQHGRANPVVSAEPNPYGTRYIVEGVMQTPSQRPLILRTVWFIEYETESPRLITAYPIHTQDNRGIIDAEDNRSD